MAVAARPVAAQSNEPREIYVFGTLGLGGDSDDSYVDRHGGTDLLPYTDDDVNLPPRGNVGGTWGFAHHDLDSDGVADDGEHVFDVIRRDDDDAFTFSAMTRPEYGVLYESEDWVSYHDARNKGPSATSSGDVNIEGGDFEHNDRPAWESESNAFMYNNREENQHGKGKPKYYFENINPGSQAAAGVQTIWSARPAS